MSEDIDIDNLAHLARIDVPEDQVADLQSSIKDILEYVSAVEAAAEDSSEDTPQTGPVYNVLREDTDPHEPGKYTDKLTRPAPATDADGYIVVPPILS